jgi:Cupredoxin-like domain
MRAMSPPSLKVPSLNREKVVPAGQSTVIYVGPLAPGTYAFFDDFHPSARGRLVAK